MSDVFVLQRAYLASQHRREEPSALAIVGTLLDLATPFAPTDRELERLVAELSTA